MEQEKIKKGKLKVVRDFKVDEQFEFFNRTKSHKFWSYLHRIVAFLFLGLYLKLKFNVKVVGKEKLKQFKDKSIITISNHIHHLDIQMIGVCLFGIEKLNWLTLESNLSYNVKNLILNSGGIPIPTNPILKPKFFRQIGDLLKSNQKLHICPEGSLEKNYDGLRPFKIGAFRFCSDYNIPLVPITIKIKFRGKKNKPQYILVVNDPIYPGTSSDNIEDSNTIMNKAYSCMQTSYQTPIIFDKKAQK